ncbi:unnamed protein product [Chrysodeixis includens]|uniref:Uncharacterized protein n=1 Tax=Chrysodeixis includens TaxID=689277 RepID=A0A9N8L0L5_CHRIL|nr:unnamed protein product [Chrysodeixis includens]
MDCYYPVECEEFSVTPSCCAPKYYEEPPACYPCLPRCAKPVFYCCEQKSRSPSPPPRSAINEDCCMRPISPVRCCAPRSPHHTRHDPHSPHPARHDPCSPHHARHDQCPPHHARHDQCPPHHVRHDPCPPPAPAHTPCCNSCCHRPSKPVKTKYIIPCYRYEDGRITNQPTVLMRRACEVACGTRARRKPFVVSTYAADPYKEVRQYHSEDERGNCCFHFERSEPVKSGPRVPSPPTGVSCPDCYYEDCVQARPVDHPSCCYYCR